ncbi:hypothetical protein E4U34_008122 [Claviceps purpurea]|nr:hypothetical protein E4U34_008122 [Claviceps purpurea]
MAKTNIQTPQEHCEYSDTPRTLTVEEEYYKAPTSKEEHKSIPQPPGEISWIDATNPSTFDR